MYKNQQESRQPVKLSLLTYTVVSNNPQRISYTYMYYHVQKKQKSLSLAHQKAKPKLLGHHLHQHLKQEDNKGSCLIMLRYFQQYSESSNPSFAEFGQNHCPVTCDIKAGEQQHNLSRPPRISQETHSLYTKGSHQFSSRVIAKTVELTSISTQSS